ncbi:MAG: hypothetical protein ABII00_00085 [Elusimicrobiota bacterium]
MTTKRAFTLFTITGPLMAALLLCSPTRAHAQIDNDWSPQPQANPYMRITTPDGGDVVLPDEVDNSAVFEQYPLEEWTQRKDANGKVLGLCHPVGLCTWPPKDLENDGETAADALDRAGTNTAQKVQEQNNGKECVPGETCFIGPLPADFGELNDRDLEEEAETPCDAGTDYCDSDGEKLTPEQFAQDKDSATEALQNRYNQRGRSEVISKEEAGTFGHDGQDPDKLAFNGPAPEGGPTGGEIRGAEVNCAETGTCEDFAESYQGMMKGMAAGPEGPAGAQVGTYPGARNVAQTAVEVEKALGEENKAGGISPTLTRLKGLRDDLIHAIVGLGVSAEDKALDDQAASLAGKAYQNNRADRREIQVRRCKDQLQGAGDDAAYLCPELDPAPVTTP